MTCFLLLLLLLFRKPKYDVNWLSVTIFSLCGHTNFHKQQLSTFALVFFPAITIIRGPQLHPRINRSHFQVSFICKLSSLFFFVLSFYLSLFYCSVFITFYCSVFVMFYCVWCISACLFFWCERFFFFRVYVLLLSYFKLFYFCCILLYFH